VTDPLHQDAADLAEDAKRLLLELDRDVPGAKNVTAECRPPLDVLETASTVEVVVDIPGVPIQALRVIVRRQTVLVVGVKLSSPSDPATRFHVAERGYGRFARAVRLHGAFDATRAHAVTSGGQLRVVLPRLEDRRGALISVPVQHA